MQQDELLMEELHPGGLCVPALSSLKSQEMNPFVQAASFCVIPYSISHKLQPCRVATERQEQVAEPEIAQ